MIVTIGDKIVSKYKQEVFYFLDALQFGAIKQFRGALHLSRLEGSPEGTPGEAKCSS